MRPFARARARRGTPADYLVMGLGNPGAEYAGTRHNAGSDVVGRLAERHEVKLVGGRCDSLMGDARIGERRIALAIPLTFYNEAGRAAQALVARHGVTDVDRVVIVHDELDLDPGRVKIKIGGGLAGNNGLRSIKNHLHSADFVRVRIGVGKPPNSQAGRDHVLRPPTKAERPDHDASIDLAADAVTLIVEAGAEAAMTEINRRP